MGAEDNWHLRMKDWEGSQTVVCFIRSGGHHGGLSGGHVWVVSLDATEPNSWGNFTYSLVMSEGMPPSLSRTTKMPSSCFGHWSIFKVTLMKTLHCKCSKQSLSLEAMHGLLYLHWSITSEQGSFQLLVILISSIYWFWRYCIRLNAMPFIFFNPLPRSINMIIKVKLKLIMPAYNSITRSSAFADTRSHS